MLSSDLPLASVSDYAMFKDAELKVFQQVFPQTTADTISNNTLYLNGIMCPGLLHNVKLVGSIQKIDANGVVIPSGDQGGLDGYTTTLIDAADSLVFQAAVSINDKEFVNHNNMGLYYSIKNQMAKLNDDDNLNYYFGKDMVSSTYDVYNDPTAALTKTSFASEKMLATSEIFSERRRRLLKLGYQSNSDRSDRVVLYDAKHDWIVDPIPMFALGQFNM